MLAIRENIIEKDLPEPRRIGLDPIMSVDHGLPPVADQIDTNPIGCKELDDVHFNLFDRVPNIATGIPRPKSGSLWYPRAEVGPKIAPKSPAVAKSSLLAGLLDLTIPFVGPLEHLEHRCQWGAPYADDGHSDREEREWVRCVLVEPADRREVCLVESLCNPDDYPSIQACEISQYLAEMLEVSFAQLVLNEDTNISDW